MSVEKNYITAYFNTPLQGLRGRSEGNIEISALQWSVYRQEWMLESPEYEAGMPNAEPRNSEPESKKLGTWINMNRSSLILTHNDTFLFLIKSYT
jgi:hypothetical protein